MTPLGGMRDWDEWKAGWQHGYAARLSGYPLSDVDERDPFERGFGDGWKVAHRTTQERLGDWQIIERNERTGGGL